MLFTAFQRKCLISSGFAVLVSFFVCFSLATETQGKIVVEKDSNFGVIKGIVRDQQGQPIQNAIVAVFHLGTSKILKQVRSAMDGSFLTRLLPGRYTILAVAEGFNATTIQEVEVNRSTAISYGFNLERSGGGNTLPEKKADRDSSKWRIRSAFSRRSIYQVKDGEVPIEENIPVEKRGVEETVSAVEDLATENRRRGQSVVETYFANSDQGVFTGFNFATLQPLGENTEILVAGQTGTKYFAPQRLEATLKTRLNQKHQIHFASSVAKLGRVDDKQLGQLSFQALDEWNIRSGVILVFGFDSSRFVGAGNDFSISPRLGALIDLNAKTRVRTAYTTQYEERTWTQAIELENSQVLFREQFTPQTLAIEKGKPLLNKSRRLELGVERILNNNSNIEATAFFDSVTGRGVGMVNLPISLLNEDNSSAFTANQHGQARGLRVVYANRLNRIFSASAGFAFGTGQKISNESMVKPGNIFEDGLFQTFVGQITADLKTGTRVEAIFRLSPEATVFAIDPFQGRLAIFDPGLSVLVTQSLPTLGLPIRATAILDARNLFDFQTGVSNEEGSLRLNSQQRILRGGISVRF